MKIYNIHRYSLGLLFAFIFFLLGDIMLQLSLYYGNNYVNEFYFLCGTGLFLIGRIFLIIIFLITPYKDTETFNIYSFKYWHLLVIGILLSIGGFSIYSYSHNSNNNPNHWIPISYLILINIYVVITVLTCFTSIVRYKVLSYETKFSYISAIIGTILFALSDGILGYITLIEYIKYANIIIMITYWVGILLISWSIIRNWDKFEYEKYGIYYYI